MKFRKSSLSTKTYIPSEKLHLANYYTLSSSKHTHTLTHLAVNTCTHVCTSLACVCVNKHRNDHRTSTHPVSITLAHLRRTNALSYAVNNYGHRRRQRRQPAAPLLLAIKFILCRTNRMRHPCVCTRQHAPSHSTRARARAHTHASILHPCILYACARARPRVLTCVWMCVCSKCYAMCRSDNGVNSFVRRQLYNY